MNKVKDTKYKMDTKKEYFLRMYKAPESGGNISTVCSSLSISRQTYYNWIDEDEAFAKAMYELKMEKCDEMEQQLYQRGYEKSDTALIFWLKNNHPTYKEHGNTTNVQINVQPILGGRSKE